jgi:hypothetical protein
VNEFFAQKILAFRWTEEAGMVPLGDLEEGSEHSIAFGVSGDGAVVVGEGAGDRTYKLAFGTTFEPGRYVKSLGEPVAGVPSWSFEGGGLLAEEGDESQS